MKATIHHNPSAMNRRQSYQSFSGGPIFTADAVLRYHSGHSYYRGC